MGHEGQPHTSGRSSFTVSRQGLSTSGKQILLFPFRSFSPRSLSLTSDEWAMLLLDLRVAGFRPNIKDLQSDRGAWEYLIKAKDILPAADLECLDCTEIRMAGHP